MSSQVTDLDWLKVIFRRATGAFHGDIAHNVLVDPVHRLFRHFLAAVRTSSLGHFQAFFNALKVITLVAIFARYSC